MKLRNLLVVLVAGLICLSVTGCGESEKSALKKKANQGDIEAQFKLGDIYRIEALASLFFGKSWYSKPKMRYCVNQAVKWHRLAAEQGHARAQERIGYYYQVGFGVPQDYEQAYSWYNLAAAQGLTFAPESWSECMKTMTPAQITEGQRLSSECVMRIEKNKAAKDMERKSL